MTPGVEVIEGQYFQDLMDQPRALDATLAWLSGRGRWEATRRFVLRRSWKRIVLTGMGSSYHSHHPLNLALIEAGFSPVLMETSELIHYGMALCDRDTLVVLVSQSGRSAEILRLLELNGHSTILGVTNTPDSRLATDSQHALLTQAGAESTVSSKTYVAGMLELQWLSAIFAGKKERETLERLGPVAELVSRYLENWRSYVQELAVQLRGVNHLFLTGRGGSLAAVGTGALTTKESARFHAEGMSSAAFRHGPMEMLKDDMFTVVFEGDERTRELNQRLVRDLVSRDCRCKAIGQGGSFPPFRLPECDPLLRPILEILPVQMISLALAGLAGREAGHFEHGSKVTVTE